MRTVMSRFAAPLRVHVLVKMPGEPKTVCRTDGLRDRNRPRTASRIFDSVVHTRLFTPGHGLALQP